MGELPAFIATVPDYEIRKGRMHITMAGGVELVMPLDVFLEGTAKADAAVAKWQLRQMANAKKCASKVVPLQPAAH